MKTEGLHFPIDVPNDLFDAFGIEKALSTRFCEELKMVIIEIEDNTALLAVKLNFNKALTVTDKCNSVIVTAKSKDNVCDFYSRCFCPWNGINEDPVTGAAHKILAKYWDKPTEMGFALIHLATHLNYHLGQINDHRPLLDN